MFRVSVLESTSPSLTVKADSARQVGWITAGVFVSDTSQGGLVIGQRVTASQRHRSGHAIPDAGDRTGVGERQ